MAEKEVSSIIADILDAFQNASNVFRNTARKHKRRHSEPSRVDEDKLTLDSLSQRPQEIKRTFESLVTTHGSCCEVGDSAAQTSLAQILLVFNTGLIKLLNHVLSDDKKSKSHARRGVYNLSETTAMDALIALSELDLRLTSISNLNAKLSAQKKANESIELRKPRSRSSSCGQPMAVRRPPPTPRLQNGGWVRSKSDPSAISVVVASKTKKAEQRKGSASQSPDSSPATSTVNTSSSKAKEQKSPPPRYSQLAPRSPPQPRPKPMHLQSYPANVLTTVPETTEKQLVRHPSMYIVPSDFFDAYPMLEAPRYEPQSIELPFASPPIPPKVTVHPQPRSSTTDQSDSIEQALPTQKAYSPQRTLSVSHEGKRVRPPSMMTFMTASTKLGEIPDHHLPDRVLTEEELERIPMPYVVPDMLDPPRRKNRGFRFWRKQERGHLGAITA